MIEGTFKGFSKCLLFIHKQHKLLNFLPKERVILTSISVRNLRENRYKHSFNSGQR